MTQTVTLKLPETIFFSGATDGESHSQAGG